MPTRWRETVRRVYKRPALLLEGAVKWTLSAQRPVLGRTLGALGAVPDFLLIGTQKGGSTSLYRYLTAHPGVQSAAIKEIHYFSHYPDLPERWYRAHFAPPLWLSARGLQTGEASVSYLYAPAAPRHAAQLLPDVKLVVMLRNPVSRAFSHYQMSVKQGLETLSFADALAAEPARLTAERERFGADGAYRRGTSHRSHTYLVRGHYAEQLERWFAHFPRERFLILRSEDFFREPSGAYHETLEFLGLPHNDLVTYAQLNKSARVRPAFSDDLRVQLEAYFAPHNARLAELLGRTFWPEPRQVASSG